MTFMEAMTACGVNTEETLKRFAGNQGLWKHFVQKILQDNTFAQLEEAVAHQDYQEIRNLAHTLKGTSGNLGLQGLSDRCGNLITAIRQEQYDQIRQLFHSISESWHQMIDFILQIS